MTLLRSNPDLLARFRRGERKALEEVYWAYIERVERIVRRGFFLAHKGIRIEGVSNEEVTDLLHDIFFRAFSDRPRTAYDGLRDYGPYLATIARNILVDWARKRGRELSLDELELDPPAAGGDDEPPWADEETVRIVELYLAALPESLRAIHEQRFVLGRSQSDAATALGLTRQQLHTLERRLRDGLSDALRDAGIEPPERFRPTANQDRTELIDRGSVKNSDDDCLDMLLVRGRLSGSARERLIARILGDTVIDSVATTPWWRRWRPIYYALPAAAIATSLLVIVSPPRSFDRFEVKGEVVTPFFVEVTCRSGDRGRCAQGETLIFNVEGARQGGYLAAWAVPQGGGERIWYFPTVNGTLAKVGASTLAQILRRGVHIGPEQPPGRYEIHFLLSSLPLSRQQVMAMSPELIIAESFVEFEVIP